jgi:serine/threonine protein kinase
LGLLKDLEAESFLTHSRVGVGTLGFSAPEQFDDAKYVDHRCDIYGLAATLYFALTGKFPFGAGGMLQVMKRKLEHRFVPLSQLLSNISPALDQAVIRALHPNPAMRPATAEEFLASIQGKTAPADLLLPRGVTELAEPNRNRRMHVRFPVGLAATLNPMTPAPRKNLPADIVDVSAGGISLISPQGFEPDTLLHVYLPSEYTGVPTIHLVRTRWFKKLPPPDWLIGCSFLRPLANDDLDRFLYYDLLKTDTFHAARTEN